MSTLSVNKEHKVKSEKFKRHRKSLSRKSLERIEESKYKKFFEVEGVERVILSPTTQKTIGYVMGENATTEDPWTNIKVEIIRDNLDLHELSSDFLPVKNQISQYPEDYILIGFNTDVRQDNADEFFICTTIYSRDSVLKVLQTEKDDTLKRLRNSREKCPRIWKSLGSEDEVDEIIIHNVRPLLELEYEIEYLFNKNKVKFQNRLVDGIKDGYIELLPSGRYIYNNIKKKRIDSVVQLKGTTRSNECQSALPYPKHMFTQYFYEYKKIELADEAYRKIDLFLNSTVKILDDYISVNNYINLHKDDYFGKVRDALISQRFSRKDVLFFRDITTCQNKRVSCLTYHPLLSGILVAGYTSVAPNQINTAFSKINEVERAMFEENFAIIWCHTESLKPKLYLRSTREVIYVNFCPTNPNIVVGTLNNGQIIIWDITNKIEAVERKEIISPEKEKRRQILNSLMSWMKNPTNLSVIEPTATSAIECGHSKSILCMRWLSSTVHVTCNGKIEENDDRNEWKMQFITASLDSIVYVWDLNLKIGNDQIPRKPQTKSKRLTERPAALESDVSPYRQLNGKLIPIFKIIIGNPSINQIYPILNMAFNRETFIYTPRNPSTLDDLYKRTYFTISRSDQPNNVVNNYFTIGTTTGDFIKCFWDGNDFDQGQKINCEFSQTFHYLQIHDGPVRSCEINPVVQYFVLTVGGRVFALWDMQSNRKSPIFWRKSKERYVSGIWSLFRPSIIVVGTQDSHIELWDILTQTKSFILSVRLSGKAFIDIFSDGAQDHVRKSTFATSDNVGAIRIYLYPKVVKPFNENYMHKIRFKINHYHKRMELLEKICTEITRKNKTNAKLDSESPETKLTENKETQDVVQEQNKLVDLENQKKETFTKFTENKYKEKQERYMYETLLSQKDINLAELEENKKELQRIADEQFKLKQKQEEKLSNKDKLFEIAKKSILVKISEIKKKKVNIAVSDNMITDIKNFYISTYKELEANVLNSIKPFGQQFDWSSMVYKGKQKRQTMNASDYGINFHKERRKKQETSHLTITKSIKWAN